MSLHHRVLLSILDRQGRCQAYWITHPTCGTLHPDWLGVPFRKGQTCCATLNNPQISQLFYSRVYWVHRCFWWLLPHAHSQNCLYRFCAQLCTQYHARQSPPGICTSLVNLLLGCLYSLQFVLNAWNVSQCVDRFPLSYKVLSSSLLLKLIIIIILW